MSFLGHLEELRKRIFHMLAGIAVAFTLSLWFCERLWFTVAAPAREALTALGVNPPNLVAITPMEQFNVIWFKLPTLVAVFVSSPWILYQVWAFIAPGLYKKERRWAAPFVLFSAGLFILGGAFAYFVAFRFGLKFLLGVGHDVGVTPMVTISEYFDLFVNVMLGIGTVFELPVLIFFLTLLRIVTPGFLVRHSRYAILGIFVLAAIITPTPDVFNMMLFATPMVALFYLGIFASYILVLKRENRSLPWAKILGGLLVILLVLGVIVYFVAARYQMHFVGRWPFLMK
jgi:sec-independent protein translocase protein TatC